MANGKIKVYKGFTLLEVIVSIFIFVMMMVGVTAIFAKTIKAYKNAKNIQRNLESDQFAMNQIAKTLRTSTIAWSYSDYRIKVWDYSRTSYECIEYGYYADDDTITMGSTDSAADADACQGASISNNSIMVSNVNSARFYIVPSSESPNTVGRVTVVFEICADSDCEEAGKTRIQTTVSLRDYPNAGIE